MVRAPYFRKRCMLPIFKERYFSITSWYCDHSKTIVHTEFLKFCCLDYSDIFVNTRYIIHQKFLLNLEHLILGHWISDKILSMAERNFGLQFPDIVPPLYLYLAISSGFDSKFWKKSSSWVSWICIYMSFESIHIKIQRSFGMIFLQKSRIQTKVQISTLKLIED